MKEKLRLKERQHLNNIKTRINNLKIRTKILVLVVLICFFAMGSLSVASYFTIRNISHYSLEINNTLVEDVTQGAGDALREQAQGFLLTIAREQSRSCGTVLNNIKSDVSLIEGAVRDLFINPQYYELGRPIVRPQDAVEGVYGNTYTLPKNVYLSSQMQEELRLLSNLSPLLSGLACDPNILQLYVGMRSGLFYNYTDGTTENPDFNPRVRPWYFEAYKHPENVVFTDAHDDGFGNGMVISAAKAIFDDNNKMLGVAALDIKLETMKRLILSTRVMDSGYVFILDSTGSFIIHPNLGDEGFDTYSLKAKPDEPVYFAEGYRRMMNGEEGFVSDEIAGERFFLTYSPISVTGWSVGVIIAEEEILSSLKTINGQMTVLADQSEQNIKAMSERATMVFIFIIALIIVMVIILSASLTHIISRPLQNLTAEVTKISKDNLDYRIPVASRDEIGVLTEAFNNMADNLYEYTQHIIKLVHTKNELETVAYTDTLTGLFNRRHFMEFALIQLNRASRQNSDAFLIMIDIDHFKKVNDTYGHQVGDEVLKNFAMRVKATIRSYDLLARYGGEEFILLITDTGKTVAQNLVERIRVNICKEPIIIDEISITISASFGIVQSNLFDNLDMGIVLADKALYQAKHQGRNRAIFYNNNE